MMPMGSSISNYRDALMKLNDRGDDEWEEGSASIEETVPFPCPEMHRVRQITHVVPIHVEIEWKIEQFTTWARLCRPGEALLSHPVSFDPAPNVFWRLSAYPNGYNPTSRNSLCVFLDQVTPNSGIEGDDTPVNCRLCLVSEVDGKDSKGNGSGSHRLIWFDFDNPSLSHDLVQEALRADGSLVISCEFKYLPTARMMESMDYVVPRLLTNTEEEKVRGIRRGGDEGKQRLPPEGERGSDGSGGTPRTSAGSSPDGEETAPKTEESSPGEQSQQHRSTEEGRKLALEGMRATANAKRRGSAPLIIAASYEMQPPALEEDGKAAANSNSVHRSSKPKGGKPAPTKPHGSGKRGKKADCVIS